MSYHKLFQLEIEHEYFGNSLADMVIVPNDETRKVLGGSQFLAKRTARGLSIWASVSAGDQGATSFTNVFTFHIYPKTGDFLAYTANEIANGNVRRFSNEQMKSDGGQLQISEVEEGSDHYGFRCVGRVQIDTKDLTIGEGKEPPIYQATFPSQANNWRYYFISKEGTLGYKVEDRSKKLSFKEIEVSEETTDKIADGIRVNFPDTKLVVFESTAPITYTKAGIKNIQLLLNDTLMIKHLPNPCPNQGGIKIMNIK